MTTLAMPAVSECSVDGCSYNHDGCHAFAITVRGHDGHADCGTFFPLTHKGGLPVAEAQVGACLREDCRHNEELECHADAIRVGPGIDGANCLTYSAR